MFKALSVILILFVVGYHFDDHYILESERVAYIKYFSYVQSSKTIQSSKVLNSLKSKNIDINSLITEIKSHNFTQLNSLMNQFWTDFFTTNDDCFVEFANVTLRPAKLDFFNYRDRENAISFLQSLRQNNNLPSYKSTVKFFLSYGIKIDSLIDDLISYRFKSISRIYTQYMNFLFNTTKEVVKDYFQAVVNAQTLTFFDESEAAKAFTYLKFLNGSQTNASVKVVNDFNSGKFGISLSDFYDQIHNGDLNFLYKNQDNFENYFEGNPDAKEEYDSPPA